MFRLICLFLALSTYLISGAKGEREDTVPPLKFRHRPPVTCQVDVEKGKKKHIKRHYVDVLDPLQFENGVFQVYFYTRTDFDVGTYVEINKVRANRRGIYFLDRDIIRVVRMPNGGVMLPPSYNEDNEDPVYPSDPNDLFDPLTPGHYDYWEESNRIADAGDIPSSDDFIDAPVEFANNLEGTDETPVS